MNMDCCHHFKARESRLDNERERERGEWGDLVTLSLKEKVENQRTKEDIIRRMPTKERFIYLNNREECLRQKE